jgi:uncharacterized protein YebE (UPF0316 family)
MVLAIDAATLLTGLAVFLSRVTDVTLGTMRTISIVQGRTVTAFALGFMEISLWLAVVSVVLNQVMNKPILAVFYALGYSTGNVVGILMERKIAFGTVVLRVITSKNAERMACRIRECGCAVTTFHGEGMAGPVIELYVVCKRRLVNRLIAIVKQIEPDVFYITEQAGTVSSKLLFPAVANPTGWRAVFKKK